MEPKPILDIFVFPPQMYFELSDIICAEERLSGFAHVIHGDNICIHKPNAYVNSSYDPSENAYVISEFIKKIVEIHPDEVFIADRAWDCDEIRMVRDFCRVAGIKTVGFDLDIIVQDGLRKMYEKQNVSEKAMPNPKSVSIL